MIKAEIITDASVYQLNLVDFENLELAYDFVERELNRPDAAEFRGADDILCIDLRVSAVKSYRVYRENAGLERHFGHMQPHIALLNQAAPEVKEPEEGQPWAIVKPIQFLGRNVQVEALVCDMRGQRFVMPLTVEDRRANDAMAEGSLRVLIAQGFPGAEPVIPPPVTLTATEAVAYLVDYAEAAAPELAIPGDVNARAAGKVFE